MQAMDRSKLNEYQRQAVLDESQTCIVNANVGSGKTTVLIEKIRYLHEEKHVPYDRMVVLTFTNKAAGEIHTRLKESEPSISQEELLYFGTFHSVAMTLLKTMLPVDEIGFSRDFSIIEPEDELLLAEKLIKDNKLKVKYKNRLRKRLDFEKTPKYEDDLPLLKDLLQKTKKASDLMSFQDLISNAVFLISHHPWNPEWIIVDEVQDCDDMQLTLIRGLKGSDTHFFAVGDPNQMIYGWRGNSLHILYSIKQEFQAKILSLPINYRSSTAILETARRFQQQGSLLQGVNEEGDRLIVREQYDAFQDAGYIAGRIHELHNNGMPYEEIAVFYRLQEQAAVFESVFSKEEIPFHTSVKKTLEESGKEPEEDDSGKVRLMTLHASKGLEFTYVFITGVNEGWIPLQTKSIDDMEEERRLFYVGITRAREQVELSWYTNPGGVRVMGGPSRFIRMLPEKYVDLSSIHREKTDLQEIKRQVALEIRKNSDKNKPLQQIEQTLDKVPDESSEFQETVTETRIASHPKYGQGNVMKEDDMMITVYFEGYGEKEFLKAFSEVTIIR